MNDPPTPPVVLSIQVIFCVTGSYPDIPCNITLGTGSGAGPPTELPPPGISTVTLDVP